MESELDIAKSQITKLKSEIEHERIARKQIESTNKKLNRELSGERKGREALERVCEELAKEINRMRKDMEEEKRMLRMADLFREERVQMKLTDAGLLLEEKISELAETKELRMKNKKDNVKLISSPRDNTADDIFSANNSLSIQRRAENPHIKRGIKGFVEFPKVVRAIKSRSRHLGTKLKYQKTDTLETEEPYSIQ